MDVVDLQTSEEGWHEMHVRHGLLVRNAALPELGSAEPTCMSMQPYNPEHTCETDLDCPHVGYYCPSDPTFGEDPYFIKFCRKQFAAGQKCDEDRECEPGTVCNDVERPKR